MTEEKKKSKKNILFSNDLQDHGDVNNDVWHD